MKKKHPFSPIISKHSKSLLIGTLPPETAPFYFSNTPKTRLWDILYAIEQNESIVPKGKYLLPEQEKLKILENLSLSMVDIILEYERKDMNSVKDYDIIPHKYQNIISLIEEAEITQLLFLYKNAALWFLHSLTDESPKPINEIKKGQIDSVNFYSFRLNNREITCFLLPSPLNRGKKGETMDFKLKFYRGLILK